MSNTEIYRPYKTNKLFSIIPRERKKLKNNFKHYYEDMTERDIDEKNLKTLKDIVKENNNEKLFNKSKELNLLEDAFNRKFFNLINKEIDNTLQKVWNLDNDEIISSFRNYIENGILIPVIFYFKKIMVMIDVFTGFEIIQLFSLLEKCLRLKIFLYENKNIIWKKEKKSNKFIFIEKFNNICNTSDNNKNISIIDYTKFQSEENYQITKQSLDLINKKKISLFDFSILYQLLEKELFILIKERKAFIFNYKNIKDKIKDDSSINKIINDYEIYLKKDNKDFISLSEEQKRFIKSLIIYNNTKIMCNNESNSSILSILSEINLEYEINFRILLLSNLMNYGKDLNIKNEFVTISYYLLFKLLYLQTEETQSDIINIINKPENKNSDFLKDLSKIFYNKIILSIIEYLNPCDKLIYSNYFISCYLLWIFKFLFAKENKFFKLYFIRSLSYKYISNIFYFFRDNQIIHNNLILEKSIFESSMYVDSNNLEEKSKTLFYKNGKEKNEENLSVNKVVKFYDFLLLLIPKICLISNWDKIQKLPQNNFLFDLFSSIIDLLSEIIHGNKNELLSILFDDIIITKGGGNYEKVKKIESFENFMKNIANILFDKKNNDELNIQVKKKLIDYINDIIEEKDCDETLQKCIEKYLNINKIYKNISNIMKIYFLTNIKPKNEQTLKKEVSNPVKKKISTTYFPFGKNLTYDLSF